MTKVSETPTVMVVYEAEVYGKGEETVHLGLFTDTDKAKQVCYEHAESIGKRLDPWSNTDGNGLLAMAGESWNGYYYFITERRVK